MHTAQNEGKQRLTQDLTVSPYIISWTIRLTQYHIVTATLPPLPFGLLILSYLRLPGAPHPLTQGIAVGFVSYRVGKVGNAITNSGDMLEVHWLQLRFHEQP